VPARFVGSGVGTDGVSGEPSSLKYSSVVVVTFLMSFWAMAVLRVRVKLHHESKTLPAGGPLSRWDQSGTRQTCGCVAARPRTCGEAGPTARMQIHHFQVTIDVQLSRRRMCRPIISSRTF